MAEPAPPISRNVDEFLAWENSQAERYELVGGEQCPRGERYAGAELDAVSA